MVLESGNRRRAEMQSEDSGGSRFESSSFLGFISEREKQRGAHCFSWPSAILRLDQKKSAWLVGGRRREIAPGEFLLVNSLEPHEPAIPSEAVAPLYVTLLIAPVWIAKQQPGATAVDARRPFCSGAVQLPQPMSEQLFTSAANLNQSRVTTSEFNATAQEVAIRLAQLLPRTAAAGRKNVMDYRVRHAMERALAVPSSTKVPDLVRNAGLSRSQFFERFKSCVGITPGAYLDALLFVSSIWRLVASRDSIGAISKQLSFSSPDTFARFIKDRTGSTPRSLRCSLIYD